MKKNGFTLIELLIIILIAAMIYMQYLKITKPTWIIDLEATHPYLGVIMFTALYGWITVEKIKKKQHGYAAFIFIFMAVGLLIWKSSTT
jgi:uncharacterized membrane protein YidH (DUF202 family)